jgi:hypothetical protein
MAYGDISFWQKLGFTGSVCKPILKLSVMCNLGLLAEHTPHASKLFNSWKALPTRILDPQQHTKLRAEQKARKHLHQHNKTEQFTFRFLISASFSALNRLWIDWNKIPPTYQRKVWKEKCPCCTEAIKTKHKNHHTCQEVHQYDEPPFSCLSWGNKCSGPSYPP